MEPSRDELASATQQRPPRAISDRGVQKGRLVAGRENGKTGLSPRQQSGGARLAPDARCTRRGSACHDRSPAATSQAIERDSGTNQVVLERGDRRSATGRDGAAPTEARAEELLEACAGLWRASSDWKGVRASARRRRSSQSTGGPETSEAVSALEDRRCPSCHLTITLMGMVPRRYLSARSAFPVSERGELEWATERWWWVIAVPAGVRHGRRYRPETPSYCAPSGGRRRS